MKFVIAGVFNISVLKHSDPQTQRLLDTLNSFGLKLFVNSLTRITTTSYSTIDNVFSNIHTAEDFVIDTNISNHFARLVVVVGGTPENYPNILHQKRETCPQNLEYLNRCWEMNLGHFLAASYKLKSRLNCFMIVLFSTSTKFALSRKPVRVCETKEYLLIKGVIKILRFNF